jgi:hypothetical protein
MLLHLFRAAVATDAVVQPSWVNGPNLQVAPTARRLLSLLWLRYALVLIICVLPIAPPVETTTPTLWSKCMVPLQYAKNAIT